MFHFIKNHFQALWEISAAAKREIVGRLGQSENT